MAMREEPRWYENLFTGIGWWLEEHGYDLRTFMSKRVTKREKKHSKKEFDKQQRSKRK